MTRGRGASEPALRLSFGFIEASATTAAINLAVSAPRRSVRRILEDLLCCRRHRRSHERRYHAGRCSRRGCPERSLGGLTKFNESRAGPFPPPSTVWIVARDEDGAVVGGVQGFISANWFYVAMLWVDERVRGSGVGSTLLRQAEQAGADKGCTDAYLYTFSFQAPEFYRRHGYEMFGELEAFIEENSQFWMRKKLRAHP
ncbi:GNAT family N-acetyltransferase [Hansschlegelia quercus]|uniref:GNAT family N-acetyltransferase n=1 Tax=Hansschlegelia quercus TaxID=2528245 RepID=UPI00315DE8C9